MLPLFGKPAGENRLLAALPAGEHRRVVDQLEPISVEFMQVLSDPGDTLDYVYFPRSCLLSLLAAQPDGKTEIEAGIVGQEGMAGVGAFLGGGEPLFRLRVQVAGEVDRLHVSHLRRALRQGSTLPLLLGRYTQALLTLMGHTGACKVLHTAEQRLCRWLLMIQNRAPVDPYLVTHDLLSQMLGVNRATVTTIMSGLQRRGLIRYRWGKISLVDRPGLEAATCSCYGLIEQTYRRLLEGPISPARPRRKQAATRR